MCLGIKNINKLIKDEKTKPFNTNLSHDNRSMNPLGIRKSTSSSNPESMDTLSSGDFGPSNPLSLPNCLFICIVPRLSGCASLIVRTSTFSLFLCIWKILWNSCKSSWIFHYCYDHILVVAASDIVFCWCLVLFKITSRWMSESSTKHIHIFISRLLTSLNCSLLSH